MRLLGRGPVASHEELRRQLAGEGIEATQATISRDLREIGAVKSGAGYTMPAALLGRATTGSGQATGYGGVGRGGVGLEAGVPGVGLASALHTFVVSVERGGSLVVVRTGPGHASLVAAEIDRERPEGALGTVAGDDTIFVACRGEPAARRIAAEFGRAAGVLAGDRGGRGRR